jgi:hypothetical protein
MRAPRLPEFSAITPSVEGGRLELMDRDIIGELRAEGQGKLI